MNLSATSKGIFSIILGIMGLFSAVWINIFVSYKLRSNIFITAVVPLIISGLAVYLGIIARKNNSKILGLIGSVLGVVGVLSHALYIVGYK